MAATHILSIDQGTTSSRAIVFDGAGSPVASAQKELTQHFPSDGWVEHDPVEIWNDTLAVCREAIADIGVSEIAGIGITNQRETTVVWDRATGEPVYRAIVWQDRRTADACAALKADGHEALFKQRTGLLLDPYFSGTKVAWILDNVEGARARAEKGELCFGTIDSWLVFNLTGGEVHATDVTNASRTLLFNIETQDWDEELLSILRVPREMLPRVLDPAAVFGTAVEQHFGTPIPVAGILGDQQAATVGQACFAPGLMKSTYGTGCFALVNTGETKVDSANRLLGTVAYRFGGTPTYALEGSIFMAGATVQWLRDKMGLIASAQESEALAKEADPASNVYLVPAFTGLGAPYWDPHARGTIVGMTRDTGRAEIVCAALEAVAFQTRDLMDAMADDMSRAGLTAPTELRVDGGMVANDWFCQVLADTLGRPIARPAVTETTSLGAAFAAGLTVGLFKSTDDVEGIWQLDKTFDPQKPEDWREGRYAGWQDAVRRARVE
ncbi:Glycerol kinase [Candidatus Phaeomarinobacter ectocarpi]|uniref:Glycerol kinase n=1 Tax=Candidatus Phaeomarinibacter ectocarpi TaxID=1458461 RepID=X5MDC2_9HYPH|nr:glycerol kinase GlpK [Candidatus Phaeomarinobacter ectocarpi]CDO58334.1 Glycerol kinase [Candidatus Phaeomarinobacter ectocarpi]